LPEVPQEGHRLFAVPWPLRDTVADLSQRTQLCSAALVGEILNAHHVHVCVCDMSVET